MIPNPDDNTKYPKVEIREQPGVDAEQSSRMTAYFKLGDLLRQLGELLHGLSIQDVMSDSSCHSDKWLAQNVVSLTENWAEAFRLMRGHIESCQKLMQTELLAKQSLIALYKELKSDLPKDQHIEERLCMLNTLLAETQKHKDSGLIEAISKL